MSEQKSEKECCKSDQKCCGCKKFFLGVLAGLALALLAHCFLGGGGYCPMKSKSVCPVYQMQEPAR